MSNNGVLRIAHLVTRSNEKVREVSQDPSPLIHVDAGQMTKMKTSYPEDKAVGFELNQVRGAITLKKPL